MIKNKYSGIRKLRNFKIHAQGHYVMISGITPKNNKYTFMATTSVLKYILCDMNQKIVFGPLSMCQMGSIFCALDSINCDYKVLCINDQLILVAKNRENGFQKKRLINK